MPYEMKDWRKICAEKDAEIKRLNEAVDQTIKKLEELADEAETFTKRAFEEGNHNTKFLHAGRTSGFVGAKNIILEEVKGIKNKWQF